jgi:hypothetical protein
MYPILMLLIPGVLLFAVGQAVPDPSQDILPAILVVLVNAFVVWWLYDNLRQPFTPVQGYDPSPFRAVLLRLQPINFAMFLPFLMGALWLYSAIVFPTIPRALGGGAKPVVKVFLGEASGFSFQQLGLPLCPGEKAIGPVALIIESGDSIAIQHLDAPEWPPYLRFVPGLRIPGVVKLDRKLVVAMQYAPTRAEVMSADTCI